MADKLLSLVKGFERGDALDSAVVHKSLTETITGAKTIYDFKESRVAVTNVGGTAATISLSLSSFQSLTLVSGATCFVTMPAVSAGKSFTLFVSQPTSGAVGNVNFPSTIQWGDAGVPLLTSALNKLDIFSFVSDGVKWYGSYIQGFTYAP